VIAIDRPVLADFAVLEADGFLLGDEDLDILAQLTLVAFQSQDVISPSCRGSFLRDITLAPIASMVTIAPSIARLLQRHDGQAGLWWREWLKRIRFFGWVY
jgi:hypothetical protein